MSTSHSSTHTTAGPVDDSRIREATRQLAKAVAAGVGDWSKGESADRAAIVRTALRNALWTELAAAASALDWAVAESPDQPVQPVSEALRLTDTEEGRLSVVREATSGPYPRYHALPGVGELLLRTEANGAQTIGRFVAGEFREIG